MPSLTCPRCRRPFTAANSPVATCPACRVPVRVPATPDEPFADLENDPEPAPRRRYSPQGQRSGLALLFGFVGVLAVVALGLVIYNQLDRRRDTGQAQDTGGTTTPTPPAPKVEPKSPAPPVAAVPVVAKPKDPPRGRPPLIPDSLPTLTPDQVFEEGWRLALKRSDELDAEEPEQTKKDMAVLTFEERAWVQRTVARKNTKVFLPEEAQHLRHCECIALLTRISRAASKDDPRFRKVIRAFWDPEADGTTVEAANHILGGMNVWGSLGIDEQQPIFVGVEQNKRDFVTFNGRVRNSALLLGGRKWLESR